jgi:hypothetical protein
VIIYYNGMQMYNELFIVKVEIESMIFWYLFLAATEDSPSDFGLTFSLMSF